MNHAGNVKEPRASGVGAQFGAPGPSRECRPLLRAVMLYLWRHHAKSTMVYDFCSLKYFCKNFRGI